MARTTPSQVKAVLGGDYDAEAEPTLTPYIDWAGALVDDLDEAATTSPTTARLTLIETWLAAHAYVMSDQPYEESSQGKSMGVFQGSGAKTIGKYLEASKYGQQAILLDGTGYLINLGQRRLTVGATWLGKTPSEQINWWDRD